MRVDFYLYNAHEVVVWEPIVRELRARGADARFVLEPPGVHTAMGSSPQAAAGWRDDKSGALVPLMDQEAFVAAAALLAARGLAWIEQGRYLEADAVVTTQGVGWLWRYRGLKLKTAYGSAMNRDVYGHSEMNRGLDGVLVHGEEGRERIARHVPAEDVVVVGYPKWAAYFRGEVDRAGWQRRFGLDPARRTVVYLATWAHNSSLDRFGAAVAALAARHNVLVKPHHNNLHFERARLAALRASPGVVVEDREPSLVPFLAVADVAVADARSGGLTEAFLGGKPAIALSARGDLAEDQLLDGAVEAAPLCADPARLGAEVESILAHDRYAAGRRRMVARLFTDMGGRDDAVAAQAIVALVARKLVAHANRMACAVTGAD